MLYQLTAVLAGIALGFWLLSDDDLDNLKGKRVLVTGASDGVGKGLAYMYAQHGATVTVTARRRQQLNEVVAECSRLSPSNASHLAIPADMKDRVSIQKMVKEAADRMGGLDIVVLNHITSSNIATFTGSDECLQNVHNIMDINFRSYIDTAAYALPYLTESEGVLVVVNSLMGQLINPKLAAYVASKYALNGFFGSLRYQFIMEERNVAVTSCVLGLIETPNAMKVLHDSKSSRMIRFLKPASIEGAARAIAAGSSHRHPTIYYPNFSSRLAVFLHRLFPSFMDYLCMELARS